MQETSYLPNTTCGLAERKKTHLKFCTIPLSWTRLQHKLIQSNGAEIRFLQKATILEVFLQYGVLFTHEGRQVSMLSWLAQI